MGWASEAAQKIQTAVDERTAMRRWTMFATGRIQSGADSLWESLAKQVESDTREFDEGRNCLSGLRAERLGLTNVKVRRFLAPLQNLDFIYAPKAAVEVVWNGKTIGRYGFGVDDKGTVWFTDSNGDPVTPEDISRLSFYSLIQLYNRL